MNRPSLLSSTAELPARRDVCVVFADTVGSTRYALSHPLEVFTELMTELLQVMSLACESRGGDLLPHQGDAVVSLWPATQATFALDCAAELHGRVTDLQVARRLDLAVSLRIGVACGEAMLADVGGSVTAFGAPMSLARRLCDAAAPSQTLLCGEATRAGVGALTRPLDLTALPDFPSVRVSVLERAPSLFHMKIS